MESRISLLVDRKNFTVAVYLARFSIYKFRVVRFIKSVEDTD